jgi:hypothetical protein
MIEIIEDCSPFYIRFRHPSINDIIELYSSFLPQLDTLKSSFSHLKLPLGQAKQIIDLCPLSQHVSFNQNRVSGFVSKPGLYYRAHKDGLNHRFSINYTVSILDDKCITSWYSDQDLQDYIIDELGGYSRECINFDKLKHKPIKQMIAKQSEGILFNTDIFHDWDNSNSSNARVVLTLRATNPGNVYFDDVKQLLYKI